MNTIPSEIHPLAEPLGISIPSLYLPASGIDLTRWAVVACDQYTSQPEYWNAVETLVGSAPSTLRLVLPEIYLEQPGTIPVSDRIDQINQSMADYLNRQILVEQAPGCMLVDRKTRLHPSRKGLILAIDLECYDFNPGNCRLTRATEGTVLDRIPPRQAIRKDAILELPHVQLLIDDPGHTVIESLFAGFSQSQPVYDTVLMQDGGAVRGWAVSAGSPELAQALQALAKLPSLCDYGLLFAVGDGNHSLATAKAHWDSLRSSVGPDHPARFALAEVINIHDDGLDFEPIHRALFNISLDDFLVNAQAYLDSHAATLGPAAAQVSQNLPVFGPQREASLAVTTAEGELIVAVIQAMLDDLVRTLPETRLDYIHGEDVIRQLAAEGAVGLLLPVLDKAGFFGIIARDGVLPRKTFSMGEAFEKRYYFESRRIR
jgi:hypothetical protein